MSKMIELHFVEGENRGVRIKVSAGQEVVFGRSEKCDVCLTEKKISRRHCRIFSDQGAFALEDLGSTNGTFLNDQRLKGQAQLRPGDRIRVGTSIIETQIKDSEVQAKKKLEVALPASPEPEEESSPLLLETAPPRPALAAPAEKEALKKPLSGNLSEMGLADLLQTLAVNRRSGYLLLNGPAKGEVLLRDGVVVGAKAGKVAKEKGFYRLLSWSEADFEFVSYPAAEIRPTEEEVIEVSMENLLLEGYRQLDEMARLQDKLPGKGARLKLNPEMPEKLSKLHPRVLDVLQLLIRHGKQQEIFDQAALPDLDVAKTIVYLLKKKYALKSE